MIWYAITYIKLFLYLKVGLVSKNYEIERACAELEKVNILLMMLIIDFSLIWSNYISIYDDNIHSMIWIIRKLPLKKRELLKELLGNREILAMIEKWLLNRTSVTRTTRTRKDSRRERKWKMWNKNRIITNLEFYAPHSFRLHCR